MMRDEATIHPDMAPLLRARSLMPPTDDVAAKRRNWDIYTAALAVPLPPSVQAYDRVIPAPGHDVPVRVYDPQGAAKPLPCIVYLHGGGFMLGGLDSSDTNAWGLCDGTGAIVVSVDYRLTPEHPFPAAFDDCMGVLSWLAANGGELGIDPAAIALCGDSAGGSLAAACCLAARDRGGPAIAAQALVYPTLGADPDLPSYAESRDGPSLTTAGMIHYNDLYFSGDRYRSDPYAAPAKAPDLAGLPPAFIHTAEFDPIRDDGRLYAARLARAGVWVSYREARAMLHGFLRVRETGAEARREFTALCAFLERHLFGSGL